jgi:DNA-binding ferritin-like protein (Dps family)
MTSDMLQLTKQELEAKDALTPKLNYLTERVVNAVPFTTVPHRMKCTIAVSQITNFAAQFKRNVVLWDDTQVPINAISFIIAGSGLGKDSSVRAARKCFSPGFDLIENARQQKVINDAIDEATRLGEESPTEEAVYKEYLKPVPPIDIMPTTGPGLVQHVNDIGALGISSGFMYAGEFSDELASNADMLENIKTLAEIYDLGVKEAKYTKGAEHRSAAIDGQPVSALFVGSPGHILYDETTKKKFHVAFMSKLARRSWFCYTPEKLPEPVFSSLQKFWDYEDAIEDEAKQARAAMMDDVNRITKTNLDKVGQPITVSSEVKNLFRIYKRYNNDLVDSLPNQESTYALIRRHLQWKALKLAGAYAILDEVDEINEHHYIDAIRFCELLDKDMETFEADLSKSTHERFSDYIRTETKSDGKAVISTHDMKKKGFLSSVSRNKLQELISLCAGYDPDGIYTIVNEGGAIQYERVIKTDELTVSYKHIDATPVDNALIANDPEALSKAKEQIAMGATYGYEAEKTKFDQLHILLQQPFAYSPFEFRNGTRGRNNIMGGTKWLVLDVDQSSIRAENTHFYLSDINHYVVLSSDPNNEYKYRIIIELDSYVELSAVAWKQFYLRIAEDLALRVDPVPQSQIFFSYGERPMWYTTDAQPLETRDYIMAAREAESEKASISIKSLQPNQRKAILSDPLTHFQYAYEAPYGSASRNIIRAMYYLRDIGGTLEEAIELYKDIQSYWEDPFDSARSDSMVRQIEGMF